MSCARRLAVIGCPELVGVRWPVDSKAAWRRAVALADPEAVLLGGETLDLMRSVGTVLDDTLYDSVAPAQRGIVVRDLPGDFDDWAWGAAVIAIQRLSAPRSEARGRRRGPAGRARAHSNRALTRSLYEAKSAPSICRIQQMVEGRLHDRHDRRRVLHQRVQAGLHHWPPDR